MLCGLICNIFRDVSSNHVSTYLYLVDFSFFLFIQPGMKYYIEFWVLTHRDMMVWVFVVEEEARKTKRPTAGKILWRKVMTGGKPQGFWLIIMASGFFLNMTKRGFSEVVENECHAEFFPMEFWTEKYEDELESIKRASRYI